MADPFVAEIRAFPFNFAPRGWAFCNGQLLPISQNTALFSLLGTTYGGNGTSTFALPDLQGRAAVHPGQGPGLSLRALGETGGVESVTLLESEIPHHRHTLRADQQQATQARPADGRVLAASLGGMAYAVPAVGGAAPSPTTASPSVLAPAGGSQPHNNMQPYLTLNYCIALQGVFPPRG
ncbi:phage tail protein [Nocardioides currus]|uniref:Phage tail protein n=1 Tax=Nocardioides currus TaxID=2133958 RepID=A0A2R7YYB5_9ACTN|nr:tail fiber protein [Nocardioides currus]PUA81375.1 phage tail protein [Nocardioides currus]